MRRAVAPLLALVLGAAAALLVACGGASDSASLIPSGRAASMQTDLDRIDAAVRDGACNGVGDAVARLQSQVNGLSSRVDAGLRRRLQEGVANLATVAPRQCAQGQTTMTTTTTTPPVTTAPPTTATTPTTTTPPPTTTATTPPPTTTSTTTAPPPATTPAPGSGSGGATVPSGGGAGATTP